MPAAVTRPHGSEGGGRSDKVIPTGSAKIASSIKCGEIPSGLPLRPASDRTCYIVKFTGTWGG